ncbi:hypothetical protein PR202_ga31564 [Eleusine coracana subsp. coracana]|uniref:Morc S5 domain-containing protein n=1 Tax=Eleusine coracana subsp. coracana TaxID=191504 RepID=A0AAV5DRS5_ELECO|nr:hypothetical protein PR202_ga31564 [Eleusine coracana subsp. coracana]
MDGKNFDNGQKAQQGNRDALTDSVPSQDLETLKLDSDSDAKKTSPVNGHESADVNMEAAISTEDVVRAGGFGARDDIGSLLPTAIDSTDFEASIRDARDFEGEKEEPSHPGLGWKGKEADDENKPSDIQIRKPVIASSSFSVVAIFDKALLPSSRLWTRNTSGIENIHLGLGAVAELLDNVVDEIPHGATKVIIDVVPHPRDRRPSLLIQDGEGFKAGVSCLGANVIVFTRCVNTRVSTQSIGLMFHVAKDDKCREYIRVPMVHYKYDPMSGGAVRYEHHPGQFSINMSTLIQLSPYNSEEELLQNGEEVQLHNIAAELKHSQCMTPGHNTTGRRYKVVMGFLDGAKDDGMDRFCFYHKHRLILPFVPLCASPHKNWSIIGVLQADCLQLAKNKQDFMWSDEIHILQNTLKELRITFWKHLIVEQLASIEPSCPVSLTSFVSLYANIVTRFHSQVNSSDFAQDMAPIIKPSYNDMPSYSIFGTPPSPQALLVAPKRKRQLMRTAMVNAYHGKRSNRQTIHSTTVPSRSKYDGRSLLCDIQRAPVCRPPSFPMASMVVDRHLRTTSAIESKNDMTFNASPVCTPPPPAYYVPPFSQPNCSGNGMPPNGIMRAPTPHLAKSSRLQSTQAMPHTTPLSRATTSIMGPLAPSHALPTIDMAALPDLPIKIEHDNAVTFVDGDDYLLCGSVMPDVECTISGLSRAVRATSDVAPSSSNLDVFQPALAKAHLVEPSAIMVGQAHHIRFVSEMHWS